MKFIFLGLIKLYRMTLSKILPPSCRYYPSCSEYAITAIRRFGAVKGGYLAFLRILRCNPFAEGGIDYVPEKFSFFEKAFNNNEDKRREKQKEKFSSDNFKE